MYVKLSALLLGMHMLVPSATLSPSPPEGVDHKIASFVAEMGDAVPDEETAIRIAKSALAVKVGEKTMRFQEPYHARLEGNKWIVVGDPHLPPGSSGGGFRVDISKTGEVLSIGSEA
jgi:hypothetical protein